MAFIQETRQGTLAIGQRPVTVGGQEFVLAETTDFGYEDPWSELTRGVISDLAAAGEFAGRDFLEAGIGDGRNVFASGFGNEGSNRLIGIELDDWRLALARQNLATLGVSPDRVSLHQTDIISWLTDDNSNDGRQLTGWGLACLPQAPRSATVNDADGYQDFDSLDPFRAIPLGGRPVDVYGLTLNAAYLAALRDRVEADDFDALVTLSDRVPPIILRELFADTGWVVIETYTAPEPVQQDPDTGIAWVANFDDGLRFQQRDGGGLFVPITATEAETRRLESLDLGEQARERLNVYHGLSVYHLRPKTEG